jgi:hypothetical protein
MLVLTLGAAIVTGALVNLAYAAWGPQVAASLPSAAN